MNVFKRRGVCCEQTYHGTIGGQMMRFSPGNKVQAVFGDRLVGCLLQSESLVISRQRFPQACQELGKHLPSSSTRDSPAWRHVAVNRGASGCLLLRQILRWMVWVKNIPEEVEEDRLKILCYLISCLLQSCSNPYHVQWVQTSTKSHGTDQEGPSSWLMWLSG